MANLYLQNASHPALTDEYPNIVGGVPESHVPANAKRVTLVNMMNAPCGYDVKMARLIAACAEDEGTPVFLRFWTPEVLRDNRDNADHQAYLDGNYDTGDDVWACQPDRVIVSGRVPAHEDLTEEPYYVDIIDLYEHGLKRGVPVMGFCLAAHIGLLARHGIPRKRMADKLFGVFCQDIVASDALFDGVDVRSFDMPVSRFYCSDESVLTGGAPNIDVLATSAETGASIVRDGSIIYVTGHPEYDASSLAKEYERDRGVAPDRVPANYDLKNPQNTWAEVSKQIMRNYLFR